MDTQPQHYTVNNIEFILTRKRVKNINMRLGANGEIRVSASPRVSLEYIKAFVVEKSGWINAARTRLAQKQAEVYEPFPYSKEECLKMFYPVFSAVFPLFAQILNGKMPILKVRMMKTRWGVCAIDKRTITLNMRLAVKPREALEYVVLHEYAHFVVPNHGAEFHALMARMMPDYKARRKLLK